MTQPLPTRRLGASGLRVGSIGLGLMSLAGVYGQCSDDDAIALIRQAIDEGVDFLDTADMYGWGHNETLLGKALAGRRERVVVATKFGQVKLPGGGKGVNGRPDHVRAACEASLARLAVDAIDLYYVHRIDPEVPIEDTVGAMAELVARGKVRAIGLCEASPATVRRAHRVHPLAALQTEYSLLYREAAEQSLATTRELGISFVAYSPLGRGLLTGAVRDAAEFANDRRREHPRFQSGNFERNRSLVARVEAMAREKRCTPGQLVLAWLLVQGEDVVPIPGTKRIERVRENLGALEVKLSTDELRRLAEAIPPGAAAGSRYPASDMKSVQL
jgi:aryl-alcohol dehydrogenase-like predicted oxidoreductase